MKVFQQRELSLAYEYATGGGVALHLFDGSFAYLRKDTPSCFKGRKQIAHLFDQDRGRLVRFARSLGVRVVKVERVGTKRQHVDLCGKPLARALAIAESLQ